MEHRILGRTGVKVSPLCLGGMYFGWRNDEAESTAIIHRALDLGINFIDTANVYANSLSEQYVGKTLQGKYRRGVPPPPGSRAIEEKWDLDSPESLRRFDVLERLEALAEKRGKTLSQFALAWLLANKAVTAPIIGPRTFEQLDDNIGALGWEMSGEELAAVDELVTPGSSVSAAA